MYDKIPKIELVAQPKKKDKVLFYIMVISSTELVMLGTLIPFFPSLLTSISSMGLIASVLKIHSKSDHFSLPLNLPILLVTVTCLFFTLYRAMLQLLKSYVNSLLTLSKVQQDQVWSDYCLLLSLHTYQSFYSFWFGHTSFLAVPRTLQARFQQSLGLKDWL